MIFWGKHLNWGYGYFTSTNLAGVPKDPYNNIGINNPNNRRVQNNDNRKIRNNHYTMAMQDIDRVTNLFDLAGTQGL